jgi:hypothetical protein
VKQERVLYRPDVRLRIRCESNSHTCPWPEPPEVRDVGVFHVRAHDPEHPVMGMRPSGNVRCHCDVLTLDKDG